MRCERGPGTGRSAKRSTPSTRFGSLRNTTLPRAISNPTDGRRETFDQLYPTPHDKYGLADQVGWKNIHHVRAGVEITPFKKLALTGNYHSWWLASANDAFYGAGSGVVARVPGGAADRHVGQELDAQAFYSSRTASSAGRWLRLRLPGKVPAGGDSRRCLQLSLRDGHVRVSRGEMT